MDDDRAPNPAESEPPPRVRVRRMAVSLGLAAVFVIVIPVSVQEEEGWHLPGFGSTQHRTPAPGRTVLVGTVSSPHVTPAGRASARP